jgi:SAM-dependent methyltransferase
VHTGGLIEDLRAQDEGWRTRPLVRRLYEDWYRLLVARLSSVDGPTIELGSGISRFREHHPATVATDVQPTPWVSEVADAEKLPYDAGSVANLVLIDVFHHLASPTRFLDSAERVLAAGGRVVMLEPYCSPASYAAYRRFHHERTDLSAPPFDDDTQAAASPMASNQARATLVFFRHRDEYERRWPALPVVERRLLAHVTYPLSGGLTRPQLAPALAYRPLALLDRALSPLSRWLAFRCLVVLERRP